MPDRLFLDANVLFTAAYSPRGKAAFLFEIAASEKGARARWVLLSSAYAIEESRRNLSIKARHALSDFESRVQQLSIVGQPSSEDPTIDLPSKDVPIWTAARAARVTHLLTGDRSDFGRWMNRPQATAGIVIQTVSEYLRGL